MPPKKATNVGKKVGDKVEKPTGKKKPEVAIVPAPKLNSRKKVNDPPQSSTIQSGGANRQTNGASTQTSGSTLSVEGEESQLNVGVVAANQTQPPMEEGRVVILEVCDYDKPFPKHALDLGRALHAAGFSRSKELTKIGRFRYKVELQEAKDRADLTKVDLASLNLKPFIQTAKKQMICFIRGVPLDFSEEEIQEIQCEVPVIKVERMKRRGEGEDLVDTPNLKVTVQGTSVPRMFRIFGVSFRAEQYIFPVKQCRTCWRFGHTSKVCFGNPRCQVCGKVHASDGECQDKICCRNCRGNHEASDRSCPERKRRADIFRTMAKKNMPYAEAEKEHPKESNRFGLLQEDDGIGEGVSGFSYARVTLQERRQRRERAERSASKEQDEYDQRGRSGIPEDQGLVTDKRFVGNHYRATDFEAFMAQMRNLFRNHLQSFGWLGPIKHLRDKLADRLKQDRTEIETDQILIRVCTDLTNIIEGAEQGLVLNRINPGSGNGQ